MGGYGTGVLSWDLSAIETPGGRTSPVVLFSEDSRAVLVGLNPGQELGDHQTREREWILVVEGEVEVDAGGERLSGREGTLLTFAPAERRSIRSGGGARLLLVFAPWPGEGHYQR